MSLPILCVLCRLPMDEPDRNLTVCRKCFPDNPVIPTCDVCGRTLRNHPGCYPCDPPPPPFDKYVVKREAIERIEVIGPMAELNQVSGDLFEAGFHITRSGPYCDNNMWPTVDIMRFQFIAERTSIKEGV